MSVFSAAPASLIDSSGKPAFGVYGEPIRNLNLTDFDYRPVAVFPFNLTPKSALSAIKRWQYMGLVSPEIVLGMAVIDIGFTGSAFAYSYVREEKKVRDYNRLDLSRGHTKMSATSVEGVSEFIHGDFHLRMKNDVAPTPRHLELKIGSDFEVEFTFDEENFEPLCVVTQNGLRGYNYCHKSAGLPVKGFARVGERKFEFWPETTMGVLDWSAGCPAHYTFWNWASASGRLSDGRRIGMNLSSGVNERGYTENVYWIGGKPVKTDTMYFEYDPKNFLDPWRIRSADGKVDLKFFPENERAENVNLGIIMSRFRQPFGRYEGTFLIDGKTRSVELFGYAEEHEAKW